MKTRIILFISMLLLNFSISGSQKTAKEDGPDQGTLRVFTSPEIYDLTTKWTSEYSSLNPALKIKVVKAADKNITRMLAPGSGIGFITNESNVAFGNQSIWNIVVGRDVIVPVMNVANPFIDEIYIKGISPENLARIFKNPENQTWGILLENAQNSAGFPVHYYFTNDESVRSGVAKFLNINQLNVNGIKVASVDEMITAIQKDPNAMGFCKLAQITDPTNQKMTGKVKLIPIDKNGNGKIDYMEAIYADLQTFSRGVWIGKYPNELSENIYSVAAGKPKNETEMAFLTWVLSEGQKFLNVNGYSDLVYSERQTQLEKVNRPENFTSAPAKSIFAFAKLALLVLVAAAALVFIFDLAVKLSRNKKRVLAQPGSTIIPAFDEGSMVIPKGLYFDKTHTWAFMKKNGMVKLGIDDFLQHITGSITHIEMRSAGEIIKKGDRLLTIIQKGKQLDIYSPVSGTITAQNKRLNSDSFLLNSAPYSDGWVYLIEPANWLREIRFLNMAEKYRTWINDEFSRLKDFFAFTLGTKSPEFDYVFQDGGAIKDNILADFGPEVWDDFQTKFIDRTK